METADFAIVIVAFLTAVAAAAIVTALEVWRMRTPRDATGSFSAQLIAVVPSGRWRIARTVTSRAAMVLAAIAALAFTMHMLRDHEDVRAESASNPSDSQPSELPSTPSIPSGSSSETPSSATNSATSSSSDLVRSGYRLNQEVVAAASSSGHKIQPAGGEVSYSYDASGRLIAVVGHGYTVDSFQYDVSGRTRTDSAQMAQDFLMAIEAQNGRDALQNAREKHRLRLTANENYVAASAAADQLRGHPDKHSKDVVVTRVVEEIRWQQVDGTGLFEPRYSWRIRCTAPPIEQSGSRVSIEIGVCAPADVQSIDVHPLCSAGQVDPVKNAGARTEASSFQRINESIADPSVRLPDTEEKMQAAVHLLIDLEEEHRLVDGHFEFLVTMQKRRTGRAVSSTWYVNPADFGQQAGIAHYAVRLVLPFTADVASVVHATWMAQEPHEATAGYGVPDEWSPVWSAEHRQLDFSIRPLERPVLLRIFQRSE